jgi:hypothetical protein
MKLDDINKKNIFKVPDNYFEDFPDRLQKRIAETKKEKQVPVIRLRTIINIAAAAVILIFAVYGVNQFRNQPNSVDQLLSDISSDEMINFLVESEISVDEFLENLDISIIASDEYSFSEELFPSESIDEETIDNLLDEYEIEMQYL